MSSIPAQRQTNQGRASSCQRNQQEGFPPRHDRQGNTGKPSARAHIEIRTFQRLLNFRKASERILNVKNLSRLPINDSGKVRYLVFLDNQFKMLISGSPSAFCWAHVVQHSCQDPYRGLTTTRRARPSPSKRFRRDHLRAEQYARCALVGSHGAELDAAILVYCLIGCIQAMSSIF